ncbi:MAG: hypothetical protein NTY19_12400, partial [Planctomycetota bacterium]|nr:hypothetical protein [Planctomycetota bacterium]
SSYPKFLTNVNGTLFFNANDGSHGYELWRLSVDATSAVKAGIGVNAVLGVNAAVGVNAALGVTAETAWLGDVAAQLVADIWSSVSSSTPKSLTNVNGTLFFNANDGSHGYELWKSDGTTAGTALVMDINAAGSSSPSYLTNVNGTLFFNATDGNNGWELWQSDGTTAGTALVMDIRAAGSSVPKYLTNVNGTLFFQADNGTNGAELWQSDGTTAGTALVKDIYAGVSGSAPKYLTNVNGTLFFQADDGSHGSELWGLVPSAPAGSLDATLTDGNLTITDVFTGGKDNHLTVQFSSPNLLITDANESFTPPAPAGGTLSNGNKTLSIPLSSITGVLTINGSGGNDTLTVDFFSGGNPIPSGGLTFNGGAQATGGSDTLILSGGTFGVGELLSTGVGAGTLQYHSAAPVGLLTFSGLEALTDDNTVTVDYTIDGTSAADMISIANGTDSRTTVSEASNNFVPVSFKNKTNVTVNGMDGDDTLTLGDNGTLATGLSKLAVDGNGGPTGHDTLTISGAFTLPGGTLDLTAATLSQTAGAVSLNALNLTGAVTQSGGTLAVGASTIVEAGTADVLLNQADNDFGSVAVTAANNVTLVDADGIVLDLWLIDGNLDVTAGGEITVSATQEVAGTARFVTKKDGGADIRVNESSSTFGSVTIQSLNAAGTAADSGMIVLGSSGDLDLASVQTSGTADIWAGGPITDSGTLSIGGAASFETDCDGGAAITLDDPSSTFGSLTVLALNTATTAAAAGAISIAENATMDISEIRTGAVRRRQHSDGQFGQRHGRADHQTEVGQRQYRRGDSVHVAGAALPECGGFAGAADRLQRNYNRQCQQRHRLRVRQERHVPRQHHHRGRGHACRRPGRHGQESHADHPFGSVDYPYRREPPHRWRDHVERGDRYRRYRDGQPRNCRRREPDHGQHRPAVAVHGRHGFGREPRCGQCVREAVLGGHGQLPRQRQRSGGQHHHAGHERRQVRSGRIHRDGGRRHARAGRDHGLRHDQGQTGQRQHNCRPERDYQRRVGRERRLDQDDRRGRRAERQ